MFYGGPGNDGTDTEEAFFDNNTRQFGGEGNDGLIGGGGKDKLFGDAGDDFLTTGSVSAAGNDNVADFVDGGDGFDTCILRAGDRAVNCEDVTVVS